MRVATFAAYWALRPRQGRRLWSTALLRFAAAWQVGDQPAALQALSAPGFTLPPQQTLQNLFNLPYVQTANVGSIDAAREMLPGGDVARGS